MYRRKLLLQTNKLLPKVQDSSHLISIRRRSSDALKLIARHRSRYRYRRLARNDLECPMHHDVITIIRETPLLQLRVHRRRSNLPIRPEREETLLGMWSGLGDSRAICAKCGWFNLYDGRLFSFGGCPESREGKTASEERFTDCDESISLDVKIGNDKGN